MEDRAIKIVKVIYDKSKLVTYCTNAFPKNDGSDRWIVEYYDVYEDGTKILSRAAECDKDRVELVTYLIAK